MSWSGSRKFNKCSVKVVEFTDYVFTAPTEVLPRPDIIEAESGIGSVPTAIVGSGEVVGHTNMYAGSKATLHCPRTEDERSNVRSLYNNHRTRLLALESLRQQAAEVLCQNCPYASMDQVEISNARRDAADAEIGRLAAYAALEEIRNESRIPTHDN